MTVMPPSFSPKITFHPVAILSPPCTSQEAEALLLGGQSQVVEKRAEIGVIMSNSLTLLRCIWGARHLLPRRKGPFTELPIMPRFQEMPPHKHREEKSIP